MALVAAVALFYWLMLGGRNARPVSTRDTFSRADRNGGHADVKDIDAARDGTHRLAGDERDASTGESGLLDQGMEPRADFTTLEPDTASCIVVSGRESGTRTYRAVGGLSPISAGGSSIGLVARFAGAAPGSGADHQLRNAIIIMLPPDALRGNYSGRSDNFGFYYFDETGDNAFRPAAGPGFTLTIVEWGGTGSRARGTFSGVLRSADTDATVTVKDGRFDIGIR